MRIFRVALQKNNEFPVEFTIKTRTVPDILKERYPGTEYAYYVFDRVDYDKQVSLKTSHKNYIYIYKPAVVHIIGSDQ